MKGKIESGQLCTVAPVDASTLEQWGRLALSSTEFETVLPSGTTISMRAKPPTVDLPDVVEKP